MNRVRGLTTALLRSSASALLLALLCLPVNADGTARRNSFGNVSDNAPQYRVYTYRGSDGVPVFTDKVPANASYSVLKFSCFACNPRSSVDWHSTRLYTQEFAADIDRAARQHGIDPALIRAVIHAESGFNPGARSHKGAIGLMQLMPGTASDMGVDPTAVPQNIHGGTKYLAMLLSQYQGDIRLATAAYNAGPSNVERYKGVPPFAETQTYVQRVKLLHDRYRSQG